MFFFLLQQLLLITVIFANKNIFFTKHKCVYKFTIIIFLYLNKIKCTVKNFFKKYNQLL